MTSIDQEYFPRQAKRNQRCDKHRVKTNYSYLARTIVEAVPLLSGMMFHESHVMPTTNNSVMTLVKKEEGIIAQKRVVVRCLRQKRRDYRQHCPHRSYCRRSSTFDLPSDWTAVDSKSILHFPLRFSSFVDRSVSSSFWSTRRPLRVVEGRLVVRWLWPTPDDHWPNAKEKGSACCRWTTKRPLQVWWHWMRITTMKTNSDSLRQNVSARMRHLMSAGRDISMDETSGWESGLVERILSNGCSTVENVWCERSSRNRESESVVVIVWKRFSLLVRVVISRCQVSYLQVVVFCIVYNWTSPLDRDFPIW